MLDVTATGVDTGRAAGAARAELTGDEVERDTERRGSGMTSRADAEMVAVEPEEERRPPTPPVTWRRAWGPVGTSGARIPRSRGR